MKGKVILWFTLFAALFVAGLGLKLAIHYYTKSLEVRLNPTHSGQFNQDDVQFDRYVARLKHIVLFGDSRIAMWRHVGLSGYEIVNRGIGGDTTAQLLLRVQRDVIALEPELVVIQAGINDLKAIGVMPAKKSWIVNQVESNLQQIVLQLNHHGIRVLLMTVLPAAAPDMIHRLVWSDAIDQAVVDINDFIRSLATGKIWIMDCVTVFDLDGRMRPEYASGALHLNQKGYEALSSLFKERMKGFTDPNKGT